MNNRPILLVEDNPDDVELTLRALKRHHIANPVVVKSDGVDALAWLDDARARLGSERGVLPAVILMDIKMPRMDGIELLAKIRAEEVLRRIPVVMLTSSKEERDLLQSYNSGANSYIRKPVDFNQFSEAIRQLGMYWLVLNEAPPERG